MSSPSSLVPDFWVPVATIIPILGFAVAAEFRPLTTMPREELPVGFRRTVFVSFGCLSFSLMFTEWIALYSMADGLGSKWYLPFAIAVVIVTFGSLAFNFFTFMADNHWWSKK
jgi:hypothetical protein